MPCNFFGIFSSENTHMLLTDVCMTQWQSVVSCLSFTNSQCKRPMTWVRREREKKNSITDITVFLFFWSTVKSGGVSNQLLITYHRLTLCMWTVFFQPNWKKKSVLGKISTNSFFFQFLLTFWEWWIEMTRSYKLSFNPIQFDIILCFRIRSPKSTR